MEAYISATSKHVKGLCDKSYYDFIIVGSGIGGGVLARALVEPDSDDRVEPESDDRVEPSAHPSIKPAKKGEGARVLLIDRGSLLSSTHCLNLPRPHWNATSLEGPSMDNDFVFNSIKSPVFTTTSQSAQYVGGPVHALGGRSIVWGLYTPAMHEEELKYFPEKTQEKLKLHSSKESCDNKSYYCQAYKLVTNDKGACIRSPYPGNGAVKKEYLEDYEKIKKELNNLKNPTEKLYKIEGEFEYGPMAAEFAPRDVGSKMYHIPMGGYSTVSWILQSVVNRSEKLHVLSRAEVVTVNRADSLQIRPASADNNTLAHVDSLTVIDERGQEHILQTRGAKVILCAGAINTAAIALRSGLQAPRAGDLNVYRNALGQNPLVGRGLTDHDIWGTRFNFIRKGFPKKDFKMQALRLQNWVYLALDDNQEPGAKGRCLLNITVNAPSFLGWDKFTNEYVDDEGATVTELEFYQRLREAARQRQVDNPAKMKIVIQVVYCLFADLRDENKVLNLPECVPTISITKEKKVMSTRAMQQLAAKIRDAMIKYYNGIDPQPSRLPELSQAGFGVVAHEVGTMRIESPKPKPKKDSGVVDNNMLDKGVVDENLKVHGWDNLFVCDLSVFPLSPSANPSITLAALSLRLGDYLMSQGI
ncbi:hypothetical protein CDD81_5415 [Ophiocordyceps australis]|uniref:Glucose-methanol-choline oxidoreductase C-terminal domain-containing protein n=1 Tax=Ophiocordyceps australis TaxID=1399860 RepID=A0A2C5XII2_9HYPO|nr:hypothetical protein CDD81_5415 [Ophiocordyceps australis]